MTLNAEHPRIGRGRSGLVSLAAANPEPTRNSKNPQRLWPERVYSAHCESLELGRGGWSAEALAVHFSRQTSCGGVHSADANIPLCRHKPNLPGCRCASPLADAAKLRRRFA
jgi:hypothetical protein